jgi:NDP-sugar pyrophosphorylase family protein
VKAVLLAAGRGTRLRDVTGALPKILVPLAGRPLLDHQLRYLAGHGVTEVAINLHYGAAAVLAHLETAALPLRVHVSVEDELLGTAGALRPLADFVDQTFVVHYGDVLTDLDLRDLVRRHRRSKALATLACYRSTTVRGKGVLDVDERLAVTAFVEKGTRRRGEHLVNAGVYVLEPAIMDYIPQGPADFGHDVWPRAIAAGARVHAAPIDAYLEDVGTPEALARAEAALRAGRLAR